MAGGATASERAANTRLTTTARSTALVHRIAPVGRRPIPHCLLLLEYVCLTSQSLIAHLSFLFPFGLVFFDNRIAAFNLPPQLPTKISEFVECSIKIELGLRFRN
jgi:hypothetical protein